MLRRTLWICAKCQELRPTRHESVIRHIVRKHNSRGEPISVTTGQTRYQMIASGSLPPLKRPSGGNSSQGSYNNYSNPQVADHKIKQAIAPGESSDLHDTLIRFRQLELANETNENVKKILDQNSFIIANLADLMKEIHETKQHDS